MKAWDFSRSACEGLSGDPGEDLPLQCVYRWERERAQSTCLTQPFGGGQVRTWTWAEAVGEARRLAAYLGAQHWPPGSRVAILSKNCGWWIMADLAIWMAGHVSVPVYPSLQARSVRQILEHSEAVACFVGATDERETPALGIPSEASRVYFPTAPAGGEPDWQTLLSECPPVEGRPVRPAEDLATIIYTSGTTGTPKGVMHSFGALRFCARTLSTGFGLDAGQRAFSYLPLAHIFERGALEAPSFLLGSQIFFTEGLETFLADLRRARPTMFLTVPRLLVKLQQGVFEKIPRTKLHTLLRIPLVNRAIKRRILSQLGLDAVRDAACGSAPLAIDVLLWYRNLGLGLAEGYGMTETMITHVPTSGSVRPGYVGPALAGVEMKLSANGELLIRSPMNMLGYYKDPQATRDAFTPDGFFRTGDLAVIEPDGQLKIVGRIKEQFKTSKGKYVAPVPIENKLAADPAVESCCVMGAGLPGPFAVIVLRDETRKKCAGPDERKAIDDSLRARMAQVNPQLDPHERILFLAVADGPWTIANGSLTPTLKLRRAALEERYWPLVDAWRRQNQPPVVWESDALAG